MDQTSQVSKNFNQNLRTFEKLKEHSKDLKNLKNDKSLTNSKLEIHCKDRLIHLSNQSEENFAFDSISQKKIELEEHSFVKESRHRIVLTI